MIRRLVTKEMLENNPHEKWNQFVDLIAMEDYNNLTEIQKIAHLCFWYDSEVQNGGHLQYFVNRGALLINETLSSLIKIGAKSQNAVLKKAIKALKRKGISKIETVEDYIDEALEGKFSDFDTQYYNCQPEMQDLLEKYLKKYENEFIILEGI